MEKTTATGTPLVPIPRTGLRGFSGVLLFLSLILSSATVGIGICAMRTTSALEVQVAEIVSAAASVILCMYLWRIGRRAKGMIPVLVFVAVALAYLTNSFIPAGVLVGLVAGVTTGALTVSIITKKQAVWLPIIPLVAYGFTLLCSWDIVGSVACLLPLLAAPALAFATRRSAAAEDGPNRVGVICLTSLALGASLLAMIALTLYRQLGSLSISTLTAAMETARESVINEITSVELPAEATEEMRNFFKRENVEQMINSVINLLPAYAVVLINLISTVAQLLLHASLVSFGCGESLTDRVRVFRMSAASCIVFAGAYLVALLATGDTSTLPGTVAQNIYTILMPGLAFAGLLRILGAITKHSMGCFSLLLIIVAPLLFFVIPPVLGLVEVGGRLIAFLSEKFRDPEKDDPFDQYIKENHPDPSEDEDDPDPSQDEDDSSED